MSKAIRIHEHGGPDVLCWDEVDPGMPGAGRLQISGTHCSVGPPWLRSELSTLEGQDKPAAMPRNASGRLLLLLAVWAAAAAVPLSAEPGRGRAAAVPSPARRGSPPRARRCRSPS